MIKISELEELFEIKRKYELQQQLIINLKLELTEQKLKNNTLKNRINTLETELQVSNTFKENAKNRVREYLTTISILRQELSQKTIVKQPTNKFKEIIIKYN